MSKENWSLFGRLKRAVKKIRFLMDFNINRWKLASIIGTSSSKRRLSFNDRPGLRACMDYDSDSNDSGSARAGSLQRTISYPSDQDDIDKRAEMFITNFYRQLKIERQISLELSYARANSFDSASPWVLWTYRSLSLLNRRKVLFYVSFNLMEGVWNFDWLSVQSSVRWTQRFGCLIDLSGWRKLSSKFCWWSLEF